MKITDKQNEQLAEVFASEQTHEKLQSVRFDSESCDLYTYKQGKKSSRQIGNRDFTFLRYVETPSKTPTGGRYVRKQLTVRDRQGQFWVGNIKRDTDIVRLRRLQIRSDKR